MKQRIIISVLFLFFAGFFANSQQIISPITQSDGVITVKELQQAKMAKKTVNPVALKAIQQGEKKGEFQNVNYTLAPNVKRLTTDEKNQLIIQKDGILNINKPEGSFVPSPDVIYLDDESDLVFQSVQADEDKMIMVRPKMYEIFENIEIPLQEVKMTLANTSETAPGMQTTSTGSGDNYAVHLQFDSITYTLDSTKTSKFTVTLIGEVSLTNPRVEGRYSKNGGYSLIFKTEERVSLRARTNVKVSKEKKVLLWGTEIPVKDIGKCELGVFAVVSVSGEVTLVVDVQQGVDVGLGARGGTCYYIPTSIHNASYFNQFCEVGYELKAKMQAFAGVQCSAKLKFKSYDVLDVYVKGGMEGTVESDMKTLSADVGVRFKAGGKIVSKKFTLVDEYFSLWKLQQPDMAGYKMDVHEVCALGDYVVGEIQKTEDGNNYVPYNGALKVVVQHPNGSQNKFDGQCTADGLFLVKNVPLRKGDKVAIELAGVNNLSSFMEATLPFKNISLTAVDYYTNTACGSVAAFKSDWYKLTTQSQAPQDQTTAGAAIASVLAKNKAANIASMVNLSQSDVIKRITDFKNNLITYKGEVTFITKRQPSALAKSGANAQKNARAPLIGKQPQNKGYVNNPFGWFAIGNLDFSPNQEVKAHIELEGFVIESDWAETDGLLVSEIITDGLQVTRNLGTENLAADNSFVIVSAVRGDNAPSGTVRMLQGVDMPHATINNKQIVPEFPDAKNAIVFFDKTVQLTPVAGQEGLSLAQTGAWTSVISSTPDAFVLPAKNGRHPFEKVSYDYKNNDLGFEYFIDECHSCRSPQNVIDRIGKLQDMRLEGKLQNVAKKMIKQTPKVNPGFGGGIR